MSSHSGNYFWYHDDQPVSGGQPFQPFVAITDVQPADAGEYHCVFQTLCGQDPILASSNIATLSVSGGNPCPGDISGDGSVGLSDLTILLSNFGTPAGATPEQGDLNGDGAVSLSDLTILLAAFGSVCP